MGPSRTGFPARRTLGALIARLLHHRMHGTGPLFLSPSANAMVLTFVIEDPLAADDGRSSSSPEAPLGRTVTGEVRQRRWAPRARTGCLTCRLVVMLVLNGETHSNEIT